MILGFKGLNLCSRVLKGTFQRRIQTFRQGGVGGLQTRGGGGHPDPEIMGREGRKSQKIFFQFGLKITGGGRVPRPPPLELLFPSGRTGMQCMQTSYSSD